MGRGEEDSGKKMTAGEEDNKERGYGGRRHEGREKEGEMRLEAEMRRK